MEDEKNKLTGGMVFDENRFFIKPNDKIKKPDLVKGMEFDARPKSFEEKVFIILYVLNEDDEDEFRNHCYSLCIGRTETYNDIKDKLISGYNVDVHKSKIITETKQIEASTGDGKYYLLPYEECISLYSFCISVMDYYSDDSFNIEEYNNTEVPEKDELEKNPMYMTAEQIEYMKMLNSAISADRMIESLKNSNDGMNI